MELSDYLAALRRRWLTWAVIFVVSVSAALLALETLPRSYQATAQIFVGTASESTSGFQFVGQRVKSYPDVAESPVVLRPVMDALGLRMSLEELRRDVSATNPADTTQIEITATSSDAEQAAAISNAVAEEFAGTLAELERGAGEVSPVSLTITSPATVPSTPVSPEPRLVLALGLVFGLFVGAGLAILRDRTDSTLHTEADVRRAWGPGGDDLPVVAAAAGAARRSRLIGRPATLLARRLQLVAEHHPVRALLLSPTRDETAARCLATDVSNHLHATGTTAVVATSQADARSPGGHKERVRLAVGTALGPVGDLRVYAGPDAAVVVVLVAGEVHAAELPEVRRILDGFGVEPLAVVLLRGRRADPSRERKAPAPRAEVPLQRLTGDRATPVTETVAAQG